MFFLCVHVFPSCKTERQNTPNHSCIKMQSSRVQLKLILDFNCQVSQMKLISLFKHLVRTVKYQLISVYLFMT